MGMDDRNGAYRSRGQQPRRRPYDGDDLPASFSSRGESEMNSSRYDGGDRPGRPSSRAPREPGGIDNPRSRPPRREYDSGGDYDRPTRDPRSAPRGGSSGGSSGRYDRDGNDRRPRPGAPPRGDRRGYDNGYDDYDRPNRSSRSDPGASNPRGERTMRGGRPPARDEGWNDPRDARVGARGPSAGGSNERMRRPVSPDGRGGLWNDEPESFRARNGGINARDPRARRLAAQQEEEEESGSPAAAVAKAIGAIALALVLGAGSAYGYFVVSTPKLHVSPNQQAIPTSPASTPSTTPSPSATKSASVQPSTAARTLYIG